ncbi:hypothetical protein COLO4_22686 [Corchorus olitorius]|uniref:Uncharacterized protein n=1 Tax=Corchorus olitorius TaxID=93759 RepID=A0A1R3IKK1_9ROSI|nr:hypothetical protein COLO4_22686 [Corchorus olitorius]
MGRKRESDVLVGCNAPQSPIVRLDETSLSHSFQRISVSTPISRLVQELRAQLVHDQERVFYLENGWIQSTPDCSHANSIEKSINHGGIFDQNASINIGAAASVHESQVQLSLMGNERRQDQTNVRRRLFTHLPVCSVEKSGSQCIISNKVGHETVEILKDCSVDEERFGTKLQRMDRYALFKAKRQFRRSASSFGHVEKGEKEDLSLLLWLKKFGFVFGVVVWSEVFSCFCCCSLRSFLPLTLFFLFLSLKPLLRCSAKPIVKIPSPTRYQEREAIPSVESCLQGSWGYTGNSIRIQVPDLMPITLQVFKVLELLMVKPDGEPLYE